MADARAHAAVPEPRASVIVPFHRGLPLLERVVAGVAHSNVPVEIIVVANGHDEDLTAISRLPGLRVLELLAACGPAIARNRGAAAAAAPILVFVDADVIPHPTAIPVMLDVLGKEPELSGVFGAYDHHPEEPGFFSQYRNLTHAFVHEQANRDARTFWAGLGALRASAFAAVGGFDERFLRPSIEDIDLGYRLSAAGYRLRLDVTARGTHLRKWTFLSSIVTDVRDRGVPWTQALLKFGALSNDLNVSRSGRASVALACVTIAALAASPAWPPAALVALAALTGFAATHWTMLRWFARLRGPRFAVGVLGGQLVHHCCNGVSLIIGSALWAAQRLLGWTTRWTIPVERWPVGSERRA